MSHKAVGCTIIVCLLLCLLAAGGFVLRGGFSYVQAVKDAEHEFLQSHEHPNGTYEFFTRGVVAGMSEEEVDARLLPADEVHGPLWWVEGTIPREGWKSKRYTYDYGTWKNPYFPIEEKLGEERIEVWFDATGGAKELSWNLSGELRTQVYYLGIGRVDIDLATKQVDGFRIETAPSASRREGVVPMGHGTNAKPSLPTKGTDPNTPQSASEDRNYEKQGDAP